MSIQIRYFAAVRERLGRSEEDLSADALPERPTVEDVWTLLAKRHPELSSMKQYLRLALNRDFADPDDPVQDGDEIALIPPVSGGSGSSDEQPTTLDSEDGRFRITDAVLEPNLPIDAVRRSEAGALVTFRGVVRDHTDEHSVERLVYECYVRMALEKLVETGREAEETWPQVEVAIHHRWGTLVVGETAVVIAVSSPHRAEAFEACSWIIDRLKEVVPIWKKEIGPEGGTWVGMGP